MKSLRAEGERDEFNKNESFPIFLINFFSILFHIYISCSILEEWKKKLICLA